MTTRAAVDLARRELLLCSDAQIERMTACKWMERALAGYELAGERRCVRWFARAVSYHHEAGEHAAGVSSAFVAQVDACLMVAKALALDALEGVNVGP